MSREGIPESPNESRADALHQGHAEPSGDLARYGFTGTQNGMTDRQSSTFIRWVHSKGRAELTHGDCIGADEQAHAITLHNGWRIVIRPASGVGGKRAFCTGASKVHEPKPPLDRNTDIVDDTQRLVACPSGPEIMRSGTWSTVRRARRAGRPILIIWPDGSITTETPPSPSRAATARKAAQVSASGPGSTS